MFCYDIIIGKYIYCSAKGHRLRRTRATKKTCTKSDTHIHRTHCDKVKRVLKVCRKAWTLWSWRSSCQSKCIPHGGGDDSIVAAVAMVEAKRHRGRSAACIWNRPFAYMKWMTWSITIASRKMMRDRGMAASGERKKAAARESTKHTSEIKI